MGQLPGKHFILHEADARFGEAPARSLEVIGYDLASKKYLARSYDDQGVSELFEVSLKGKRWSIIGESVRFNGKFDAKDNKLDRLVGTQRQEGRLATVDKANAGSCVAVTADAA